MKQKLISLSLIISGFMTLILKEIMPVAGGGASLIFVLSIPILFGLGILFSVTNYFFVSRMRKRFYRTTLTVFMHALLIGLAFLFFPYQ